MQPTLEKPTQQTTNQPNELPSSMSNLSEAFSAQPPSQPPAEQLPMPPVEPPKKSRKKWLILLLLVILIAAAVVPILMLSKETKNPAQKAKTTPPPTAAASKTPYLFITDYQERKVILADSSGKQIYSTDVSGTPTFEASSPGKQVLLSSYDNNTQVTTVTLLGKDGKVVAISPSAQKILTDKNYLNRTFAMLEDNVVLAAVCTSAGSKDNTCKILKVDLLTGDQKVLLETTAPSAFTTGESIFNIVGKTGDNKAIYLQADGPTKLGASESAVYSFSPSDSKAALVYEFPKDRSVENLSISPDGKKLIYDGQNSNATSTTIYTVGIAGKKENSINWDKNISGGAYPFVWAQDNNKVSMVGFQTVTGQVSSIGPITLAYIDFGKNKLTELQTIQDSAHQNIQRLYWRDNSTLLYGADTSTAYHDFSNSTGQVYTQALTAKNSTKLNAPAGHLSSVIL
jgi:hypothetical protein